MRNATRQMTTECRMCGAMAMCLVKMCGGMAVFDVRFCMDSSVPYEKSERQAC